MIESLSNSKVKNWMKLYQKKYRDEHYLLLEEELVKAAHQNGYLTTLIYQGTLPFEFEDAYEVSSEVMAKLTKGEERFYIGIGRKVEQHQIVGNRVLLLDDLQDPLNIGKIMESALLFGFETLILSETTVDLYHEKALAASKGALFHLNILRQDLNDAYRQLKKEGFKIYATGLRKETKELNEIEAQAKMAFVLGNEGAGVKDHFMDEADEVVKIDMKNIDSLNVAMAAAICMYRFSNEQ